MTVAFALPDPALEAYTWVYESEHDPASHPPLTLWSIGVPPLAATGGVPPAIKVNGYGYWRPDSGQMPFRAPAGVPDLPPLELWETYWLPRLDRHVRALLEFDPAAVAPGAWASSLQALEDETVDLMGGVHITALFRAWAPADQFRRGYAEAFGSGEDALAFLHGFENQTILRAIELWRLSREVRRQPAWGAWLARAVEGDRTGIPPDFEAALQRFFDRWGLTIDGFAQDQATWQEDWAPVLRTLQIDVGLEDAAGPDTKLREGAARRAALEARLRQRAASDPEAAGLLGQMPSAQEYTLVGENHNVLCDQRLAAASRMRWLAVGRHLARSGVLEAPDAVFFLTYDELIVVAEGGPPVSAAELAERRRRQADYRRAVPPPFLGKPPATAASAPDAQDGIIRGAAASAGVHEGRARVARTLDEASRLEPGEVLVCQITSPPWTPLFGFAGAVVADAGGLFSHTSVVAREFGIPAVVGCGDASRRLRTGQRVVVDGDAGTVRVLE